MRSVCRAIPSRSLGGETGPLGAGRGSPIEASKPPHVPTEPRRVPSEALGSRGGCLGVAGARSRTPRGPLASSRGRLGVRTGTRHEARAHLGSHSDGFRGTRGAPRLRRGSLGAGRGPLGVARDSLDSARGSLGSRSGALGATRRRPKTAMAQILVPSGTQRRPTVPLVASSAPLRVRGRPLGAKREPPVLTSGPLDEERRSRNIPRGALGIRRRALGEPDSTLVGTRPPLDALSVSLLASRRPSRETRGSLAVPRACLGTARGRIGRPRRPLPVPSGPLARARGPLGAPRTAPRARDCAAADLGVRHRVVQPCHARLESSLLATVEWGTTTQPDGYGYRFKDDASRRAVSVRPTRSFAS